MASMTYIMASPFILLEYVIKKKIEGIRVSKELRREQLITEMRDKHIKCKNITTYTPFWVGDTCHGKYSSNSIKLNDRIYGVQLIETLFHEDRHYQQEQKNSDCFKGYIRAEDDYKGYYNQHVEKDARRYAYVHTMRYAKVRLGWRFGIFSILYRMHSHPWKGITYKKVK